MPQERRKRGRREERKRKREEHEDEQPFDDSQKPPHTAELLEIQQQNLNGDSQNDPNAAPAFFFGLLNDQEEAYFKHLDVLLENDQFETAEDKDIFLVNAYKECDGRQLKLASSNTCSMFLERLILLSKPSQTACICEELKPHILDLSQQRFASHCIETLLLHVARTIDHSIQERGVSSEVQFMDTLERFVTHCTDVLKPHVGILMVDSFGSHVLRSLLIALSGLPIDPRNKSSIIQSQPNHHPPSGQAPRLLAPQAEERRTPEAFECKARDIAVTTVAALETQQARALAFHPLANPVLQILFEMECLDVSEHASKSSFPLFGLLFPGNFELDEQSLVFAQRLAYDQIGSRLVEVLILKAPGHYFKKIFRYAFTDQLESMARDSIGAFVLAKMLNRVGKADLEKAVSKLQKEIPRLLNTGRTLVVSSLIERCRARDVDTTEIAASLRETFIPSEGPAFLYMIYDPAENAAESAAHNRLSLSEAGTGTARISLLVQTMLSRPDVFRELANDMLMQLSKTHMISLSKDRTGSRIIQTALTAKDQSVAFRRQFAQRFLGLLVDLSLDAIASHVVDALLEGTRSLIFLREQMAAELAAKEKSLRESVSGRSVLRNWNIGLFTRNPQKWKTEQKGFQHDSKKGIEFARDRFDKNSRSNFSRKKRTLGTQKQRSAAAP